MSQISLHITFIKNTSTDIVRHTNECINMTVK